MSDKQRHPHRGGKIPPGSKPEAGAELLVQKAEVPAVGRTFWDVVSGVFGVLKSPNVALPFSLMLVGSITLLVMSDRLRIVRDKDGGWSFEFGLPPETLDVSEGRRRKLPYILNATAILIQLEDDLAKKERHAKWQIIYTVRALQPITPNDRVFKETFITAGAVVKPDSLFSTEEKSCLTDGGLDVSFTLAEGETRVIMTGATVAHKLPLANDQPVFGQRIKLEADEMFFSYENDVDVIGELFMTVESSTLNLTPVGQAAKRSKADKTVVNGNLRPNACGCPQQDADERRQSFTARWDYLVPHEEVGIQLKVKPRRRP